MAQVVNISTHLIDEIRVYLAKDLIDPLTKSKSLLSLASQLVHDFPNLKNSENSEFETIFVLHYYYALICNQETLGFEFAPLVYKPICVNNLIAQLKNLANSKDLKQDLQKEKKNLHEKSWNILTTNQENNASELEVTMDSLNLVKNSRGKMDLHFCAHICFKLNKVLELKTSLLPWVLDSEIIRNAEYTNGLSEKALQMSQQLVNFGGFKNDKYETLKKNLAANNQAQIWQDLRGFENELLWNILKGNKEDLERMETYLIAAMGNVI